MAWGLDLVAYFLCPLTMMVEIYSALKMGKIFNKGAFKYYVSILRRWVQLSTAGRCWALQGTAGCHWVLLGTFVLILQLVAGNH